MPTVDNILDEFGKNLVTDLRESLIRNGVTFGGGGESKLSGKIRFTMTKSASGIVFELKVPDYAYWLNKDREPGPVSREGRKSIADWAERKGIVGKFMTEDLKRRIERQRKGTRKVKTLKKQPFDKALKALTFLIAKKITLKGFEGNQFMDEVLNDGRLDKLKVDLGQALKQQIIIEIRS